MSLRRRLLLAATGLLVVVALAFAGVALSQRASLTAQLDERLESLTANGAALVAIANRADAGNPTAATLLTDVYVGVVRADGVLTTVLAPDSEPSLVPVLVGGEAGAGPVTRAVAGGGSRVRLVEVAVGARRSVVVALSMTGVEASFRRLLLSLGLAWLAIALVTLLVAGWVERLGLRPIARITAAAEHVTATGGRAPVQVDAGEPGTEAGRLGSAFNAMVATTAAGQEELRRFVADASHELRTPLTTLRGYSSLYAAGGLATDEQVADAMGRINAEATRMGRIVDDLLDLTALGDPAALDLRAVDVGVELEHLAADLRVREPRRTVAVHAAPCRVVADPDRLRQAMTALVANAVKYSADDSPISLAAEDRGPMVRLLVTDRGRGIAAADLPRVFDRFYRVQETGTSRGAARGSGLGLAIVAAIVSAHGGRCGVDSAPGVGSTFWIEVPTAAVAS
ncbi:MAG: HAMP domain-containing sensor histidine kinase [Propionicimonas sp.]|uniref:sensor histidine kinase n=1 Tax=Propionicimonas sp. TaxID=1955623 RepID=UPI003D136E7A